MPPKKTNPQKKLSKKPSKSQKALKTTKKSTSQKKSRTKSIKALKNALQVNKSAPSSNKRVTVNSTDSSELYKKLTEAAGMYPNRLDLIEKYIDQGAPLSDPKTNNIGYLNKLGVLNFAESFEIIDYMLAKSYNNLNAGEQASLREMMVESIEIKYRYQKFDVLIKYVSPDFAVSGNFERKLKGINASFLTLAVVALEPTNENIQRIETILKTGKAHPEYVSMYGDKAIDYAKNEAVANLIKKYTKPSDEIKIILNMDTFVEYYKNNFIEKIEYEAYFLDVRYVSVISQPYLVHSLDYCVKCLPTFNWVTIQQNYIANLPKIDLQTITFYTSQGDKILNDLIRTDAVDFKYVKSRLFLLSEYFPVLSFNEKIDINDNNKIKKLLLHVVQRFDNVIKNAPKLDKPIVLFRGQKSATHKVMEKYSSLGILSTTLSYTIAKGFGRENTYVFFLPAGAPALFIQSISLYPHEMEVLLPSQVCFDYIGSTEYDTFLKFNKLERC